MNRNHSSRGTTALLVATALVGGCSLAMDQGMPPKSDMAMAVVKKGHDMAMQQQGGGTMDMAMMQVTGSLPFVVDTVFVTSGFEGDGNMAGPIKMVPSVPGDSTDCNGMRSSTTAAGACHVVTYMPPATGTAGWGGVLWQYPANNWGSKAGFTLPAGATKVSFQAKGAKGGEKVTFLAGGIIGAGMPHTDSLKASVTVTLTNAWAPYTIDISGQTYSQVLGGFGWTMVATDAGTMASFSVDDIQWK